MDWGACIISFTCTILASVFVCKVVCPIDQEVREEPRGQGSNRVIKTNVTGRMYNEKLDLYKDIPKEGFSWTVFFFGFIPCLFREDWKWAAIMGAIALFTAGILAIPANIFFAFKYNDIYISELQKKGYRRLS